MREKLRGLDEAAALLLFVAALMLLGLELLGCGAPVGMCADAGGCADAEEPRVPVADVCEVIEGDLGCSFACAPEGVTCSLPRAVACLEAARSWDDPCQALSEDPLCAAEDICDAW